MNKIYIKYHNADEFDVIVSRLKEFGFSFFNERASTFNKYRDSISCIVINLDNDRIYFGSPILDYPVITFPALYSQEYIKILSHER